MKKISVTVLILLTLAQPSYAVIPLIPMWVAINSSIMYHVVGALAGLVYYQNVSGASKISSSGEVTRPSEVSWVDLTLTPPSVVAKPITAKMPLSKFKDLADNKNPDTSLKYPIANSMLTDTAE